MLKEREKNHLVFGIRSMEQLEEDIKSFRTIIPNEIFDEIDKDKVIKVVLLVIIGLVNFQSLTFFATDIRERRDTKHIRNARIEGFKDVINKTEEDAKVFCEKAKKYNLILVPSDSFGCPGYFRMSYCIETEKVERSLVALREFVKAEYGRE